MEEKNWKRKRSKYEGEEELKEEEVKEEPTREGEMRRRILGRGNE